MSDLSTYGREPSDTAIDTSYNKDANSAMGRLLHPEKLQGGQVDAHVTEIKHSPKHRTRSSASWRQPFFMVLCLLCGCITAVGHHFYYRSLDGTTASSTTTQQWAIRIGTAFAILTQACFKATAVMACIQYGWKIVRAEVLTVKALDKLFDLTVDPFSLLSVELLSKSVPLPMLAALVWCVDLHQLGLLYIEYTDIHGSGSCRSPRSYLLAL